MLGCKGFKGVKTITSSIVLVATTVNNTNNQLELKANTQDEKKGDNRLSFGLGFVHDKMKWWCKFSRQIAHPYGFRALTKEPSLARKL